VTIDPFPQESSAAAALPPAAIWSTQQLTSFLALISSAEDERSASQLTVERTAEALEAEVVALVRGHEVVASIGFPSDPALERALVEVAAGERDSLVAPGLGECPALAIAVEDDTPAGIVVARRSGDGFAADELQLARGMARVLGLSLRLFRLAEQERRQRDEAETQSLLNQRLLESLQERQELLERLSRIQRSIAHGAPREEVFQAICEGARELLGEELVGLRLVPPDDPTVLELVAVVGPDAAELRGQRTPLGAGLGGRALSEDRLVVTEDYQGSALGLAQYKQRGLSSGMAAPVHEHGRPVGSLVVASYGNGHRYTATERDMLIALADHASLALSDSRRIEAMRERDAARMNTRFRALVQNSSDMITAIDPDGSIIYVSPSAERTLAFEGEPEGSALAELIHPEDRAEALTFLDRVARENTSAGPVEWRLRGRTGWLDVETTATGQLDDPDVGGVVLNSREVTERKRLEAQLRQSQRLESVGQLAGGVAHDFNNFLSVIRGYASFLEDALPADSPLRGDASEISQAAERAARLTNQLLVFSRRDVVRSRVLDLAELLASMQTLLERTVGEGVTLGVQAPEGLWRVEADPSQVEQVLMNLAVNARDAMGGNGTLTVRLENAELDADDARNRADAVAGRYVRLCVRDDGAGMEPDVVERAFEPFYTTKPKGQGTGLGLATVYGIVTQAGGSVTISSAPATGTSVEVLLPATGAEPEAAAPSEGEPAKSEPARGETILVAEDEDAVRRLTQRILTRAGYTVIEAVGGAAALAAWEANEGGIDLLLTDVVMPGMSGKELADRLGVVPVFMSGYTDDVMLRHGVEAGQPRLVQKPFDAETLLAAVRAALDEAS
jgi:PAS domain S-box-containing protein